jgi:hypothetical protein
LRPSPPEHAVISSVGSPVLLAASRSNQPGQGFR